MKILLVDDEPALTEPLSRLLTREGYVVDVAANGRDGAQLADKGNYDLLILDWMLPDVTGLQICQQLRSQGDSTPVLFLTAKDTLDDRVLGLDAGADDYLVKPFELRELLARVRALLRRAPHVDVHAADRSRLQVGDLELDLDNQLAYIRSRQIELSEKETQLLGYLMQNAGQTISHDRLQAYLWGATSPPSNVLAALVRLLRRKIAVQGVPELIHTVYGKGYRLSNDA
jgi:two-component system, OmpR family, manganese sensing response regulator